jgi:hypothetical protein
MPDSARDGRSTLDGSPDFWFLLLASAWSSHQATRVSSRGLQGCPRERLGCEAGHPSCDSECALGLGIGAHLLCLLSLVEGISPGVRNDERALRVGRYSIGNSKGTVVSTASLMVEVGVRRMRFGGTTRSGTGNVQHVIRARPDCLFFSTTVQSRTVLCTQELQALSEAFSARTSFINRALITFERCPVFRLC